jgi:hypothetical protein
MKHIYLIGFRGTGFRDKRFENEPTLIRAGHVGFAFEDDEMQIYGFHPTAEAAAAIGDDNKVIDWLKRLNPLLGAIQLDTAIFIRANELAKEDARTVVWQQTIKVTNEEFERIKAFALKWYDEKTLFTYSFPPEEPQPDRDNCATFRNNRATYLLYTRIGTSWS